MEKESLTEKFVFAAEALKSKGNFGKYLPQLLKHKQLFLQRAKHNPGGNAQPELQGTHSLQHLCNNPRITHIDLVKQSGFLSQLYEL